MMEEVDHLQAIIMSAFQKLVETEVQFEIKKSSNSYFLYLAEDICYFVLFFPMRNVWGPWNFFTTLNYNEPGIGQSLIHETNPSHDPQKVAERVFIEIENHMASKIKDQNISH